jgi:hypothetical protein
MGTLVKRKLCGRLDERVRASVSASASALSGYANDLTTLPEPSHTSQMTFIRMGWAGAFFEALEEAFFVVDFFATFSAFSAALAFASSAARAIRSRFDMRAIGCGL